MLLAIAAVHQVFGVAIGLGADTGLVFGGPPPLVGMARAGFVASVGDDMARGAVTWFLLFGFALGLAGLGVRDVERAGATPTRRFALGLAGLCALGVALMPASGFWLGFVPAAVAWRRAGARAA